ncbi:MAG: FkbM family methyltransferase [Bacteroidales bacterium]
MNLKGVFQRLEKLFKLVYYCRNWSELFMPVLKSNSMGVAVLRKGFKLVTPYDHPIFRMTNEIVYNRLYTPDGFGIGPEDVVVDIGANIGIFSVYASTQTKGPIHSFEPFPENYEFLEKNAALNNASNINPHKFAVSDKAGTEKLFISESSGGHLLFDHNIHGTIQKSIEIHTTTLPALMDEYSLQRIDFLKIDCEGAEGQIIQSTPLEYLQRINRIAMEFHDNVSVIKHDEISAILTRAGFSCSENWNGKSAFGYLFAVRK